MKRYAVDSGGYALISALGLLAILILFVMITLTTALQARQSNTIERNKNQVFYVAQSGLERAIAVAIKKQATPLPSTVNSNNAAAVWLANEVKTAVGTGDLLTGTFTVDASGINASSTTSPAYVRITSTGQSTSGGVVRRVQLDLKTEIKVTTSGGPAGFAPAALTVTGNSVSINGAAPLAGDNNTAGGTYTMECPAYLTTTGAVCTKSSTNPDRYRLRFPGAVPPEFKPGIMLRPTAAMMAAGQKSEERYLVNSVGPDQNDSGKTSVELSVLSDYIVSPSAPKGWLSRTFKADAPITMQQTNNIPALLMPPDGELSNISENVRDVCNTFECSHYTMSPDNLFTTLMGGTKEMIMQKFKDAGAYYASNTDQPAGLNDISSCTSGAKAPLMWLRPTSSTVNLSDCPSRMLIIDARDLANGANLDINLPPQNIFHGLLYIVSNGNLSLKVAGNNGFAGAVIAENGTGSISMVGNAKMNLDCDGESGKKAPKVCYDQKSLTDASTAYQNSILTQKTIMVSPRSSQWAEVGGS